MGIEMGASLPERMTAMGFDEPGGPDVLRAEDCPVPQPGADQVLIRVSHAGVNRPDVIQRKGLYPPPPGASPIPGLEISGTVVAIGTGAPPELLNQQVCALVSGGGYAEYCLAHAAHCLHVPDGMSMAEAAAIPETLFTVWHNVFERGWARDGETLLVHGGTSGIGTMAIMLAKEFGLTVLTTAGSDEKCAEAREVGADLAINYKSNLDCLAEDGRHVTIAVLGGMQAEINMAKLMSRRQTMTGSTLRPRSDEFKALLADEIHNHAWPLFEDGTIRPVMDETFPLDRVADAHRRMEAGDHIGKIVLKVADD